MFNLSFVFPLLYIIIGVCQDLSLGFLEIFPSFHDVAELTLNQDRTGRGADGTLTVIVLPEDDVAGGVCCDDFHCCYPL